MLLEAFDLAEALDVWPGLLEGLARVRDDVRAAQEVVGREAREEARRAARRQDVARARVVVADRGRREGTEEERARVPDALDPLARVGRQDLQVFGRYPVADRDRLLDVLDEDDHRAPPAGPA